MCERQTVEWGRWWRERGRGPRDRDRDGCGERGRENECE